jgi:hypothetical protein
MLCSLWADPIALEVERGECLCETKKIRDSMKKVGMLHYFVVKQWRDAVLLVDRSHWRQG